MLFELKHTARKMKNDATTPTIHMAETSKKCAALN